ncbi:hypothetical protein [Sulfitobacter sp. R18_1]|uniref:hypothetical protein n=1 Tax=Sulfitobacter sp. R18_1 TaxID=2821104 RepID=UPI001ADACAE0|nr:hypothetical protein [Sulfitobacter sp. R18_1]MBO9428616.1 hypothetical protein [Sulfitobacter sp. R18_1]
MIDVKDIRDCLVDADKQHAIPLWDAICERAREDNDFNDNLVDWIKILDSGQGGTVHLRDTLCMPLKDRDDLFQDPEGSTWKRRYPFDDAWMAIDSAGLRVKRVHAAIDLPDDHPSRQIKAHDVTQYLIDNDFSYAVALWLEMIEHADADKEYGTDFDDWLANGGTVKLRDDLCDQFRGRDHLFRDHEVHKNPWLDAWMAIDNARHQLTFEIEEAPSAPRP